MILPPDTKAQVERRLHALGFRSGIATATPIGGGCIHETAWIVTASGDSFFLKWSASVPSGMFPAEADGLTALRANGAIRAPEPIAWSAPQDSPGWLLMEYVPAHPRSPKSDRRLGAALATLHAPLRTGGFGWETDNWIGALPQDNGASDEWGAFWRDRRIGPQLERARRSGRCGHPVFDRTMELVSDALGDVQGPGLLHGDLWSGNAYATAKGDPVLVDPAVYRGDGEVDLAMSELFGGFSPAFYAAYADVRPISLAYGAHRRDLYQLYYLLVHVNLFAGSYALAARRAAERFVAAHR